MANAQMHVDYMKNGRSGYYLLHAGYKYSSKLKGLNVSIGGVYYANVHQH